MSSISLIARHGAVLISSRATHSSSRPFAGRSSGNSLLSGARSRDGQGTTQPLPIRRRVVALLESARRAAETLVGARACCC